MTDIVDNNIIENKYICEKCNFKCNIISRWDVHINSEKHKFGKRKTRSDYKQPYKCENCNYITKNKLMLLQHKLNEHSIIEEREKGFKYYCKNCDYGTVSKDLYDNHINTNKHQKAIFRSS